MEIENLDICSYYVNFNESEMKKRNTQAENKLYTVEGNYGRYLLIGLCYWRLCDFDR